MKIALLTPTYSAFSGIDRVVELQARDLVKEGNEVSIFCLKAGMQPSKGVNVVEIGMPKSSFLERIYRIFFFFDIFKIKKYGKMLKDYDLVISHLYPMNLIGAYAKKKFGVKYRYHNHGVADPELFSGFVEKTYMKLFRFLTNRSVKNADEAVSISKYLRGVLKKETGVESSIVYDKIDVERFHKGVSGDKIRVKYKLGNDPVCLYVGRISPHKGIDLLIESFNLVLKKIPSAKLLIAGKETFDEYAKRLKRIANKVNPESIIFAGFVSDEDLPQYYAACNVYTTATLWEGFNMTVVEAQACGKPVVAFDIGPHPEVVKEGILVKPKDINGFADAIIKIL